MEETPSEAEIREAVREPMVGEYGIKNIIIKIKGVRHHE